MNPRPNDIAILFFSRSESEEIQHKKFTNKRKTNLSIAAALISSTEAVLHTSNFSYFTIDSAQQTGLNFGERFSNALQLVFEKGYSKIIAIGNDCPMLTQKDLTKAATILDSQRNVLGPATDGGIYLLGIQKEHFNADQFKELRWQSAHLFSDLEQYFSNQKTSADQLSRKADIDNETDLKALFRLQPNAKSVQLLKELFFGKSYKKKSQYIDPHFISQFHQSLGLRGPPKI
ncbi:DUF2064 domain-containing protein [Reichenbachiella sp. MALMAid0571]|uniref:TIGR04282 family arsenosugar biosynthesis glycosyltransferase n=1 Tax=Reichenbachiella sp. MALMAid0571 TaxID=3143939 RepID=UPI0032DFFE28